MNSFHVIAVETVANCLRNRISFWLHSIFDIIRNIIALQCLLSGSIASCVVDGRCFVRLDGLDRIP